MQYIILFLLKIKLIIYELICGNANIELTTAHFYYL